MDIDREIIGLVNGYDQDITKLEAAKLIIIRLLKEIEALKDKEKKT